MKRVDRTIILAAAILGLGLTSLTIWAVKQQGDALRDRDRDALIDAAVVSAHDQRVRLRDELDRLFESAGRMWDRGGSAQVEQWGADLGAWKVFHLDARDATWSRLPLALFERLFPRDAAAPANESIEFTITPMADAPSAPADNRNRDNVGGPSAATNPAAGAGVRIVAMRRIAPEARLALAIEAQSLLDRYAGAAPRNALTEARLPAADQLADLAAEFTAAAQRGAARDAASLPSRWPAAGQAWDWNAPAARLNTTARGPNAGAAFTAETVLYQLGPEFAYAQILPTAAAFDRLAAQDRRRWLFLIATATATFSAWAVVVWLVHRVTASQRELVRLQKRFVADVSHELKTPLALIRLLSETLLEGRVRDPDRLRSYYETISRESERLTTLIDSILDFSRLESGKREIEFVDCDVGAVARQAWALFEPQFTQEGFDAALDVATDLPIVQADPQALQQVFVNLMQNAHRYSTERKYVRVSVRTEGFLMVITVEDRGIGMHPDQIERLGNSFFRAEDTQVRRTRGTGLGLAIVSHIVAAHRGKLEVHSRPGVGSKFTAWFPYDPPR